MNDSSDLQITSAERRLTLAALAVVVLLSALDQTIVATAMPRIIEELQGLSMYAWVTTAYMLTSTVSVPLYGKLSDQYGRKPILILGVVVTQAYIDRPCSSSMIRGMAVATMVWSRALSRTTTASAASVRRFSADVI